MFEHHTYGSWALTQQPARQFQHPTVRASCGNWFSQDCQLDSLTESHEAFQRYQHHGCKAHHYSYSNLPEPATEPYRRYAHSIGVSPSNHINCTSLFSDGRDLENSFMAPDRRKDTSTNSETGIHTFQASTQNMSIPHQKSSTQYNPETDSLLQSMKRVEKLLLQLLNAQSKSPTSSDNATYNYVSQSMLLNGTIQEAEPCFEYIHDLSISAEKSSEDAMVNSLIPRQEAKVAEETNEESKGLTAQKKPRVISSASVGPIFQSKDVPSAPITRKFSATFEVLPTESINNSPPITQKVKTEQLFHTNQVVISHTVHCRILSYMLQKSYRISNTQRPSIGELPASKEGELLEMQTQNDDTLILIFDPGGNFFILETIEAKARCLFDVSLTRLIVESPGTLLGLFVILVFDPGGYGPHGEISSTLRTRSVSMGGVLIASEA